MLKSARKKRMLKSGQQDDILQSISPGALDKHASMHLDQPCMVASDNTGMVSNSIMIARAVSRR